MSLEMLEGKELLKGKKIIVAGGVGGIDVLIRTAAKMQSMRPALTFTDEDIDFIFENDMKETVIVDQEARKLLQDHGKGVIVNFGSETCLQGDAIIPAPAFKNRNVMAFTAANFCANFSNMAVFGGLVCVSALFLQKAEPEA